MNPHHIQQAKGGNMKRGIMYAACWLIVIAGVITLFSLDGNPAKFLGGMGIGIGMLGVGWNSNAEMEN